MVALERPPDGRAGGLAGEVGGVGGVGGVGRKADQALGGQEGKCLGDEAVAIAVHLVVQVQDSLLERYCRGFLFRLVLARGV